MKQLTHIKIRLQGFRPLIMHSAAMIDPDNASVIEKNALQSQKKKLKKDDIVGHEEKRRKIEYAEWKGSLYWNKELGLYIPGDNIFACFTEGAKKAKAGKLFTQAVVPIEDIAIKTVSTTTDLEKLWEDKRFQLRQAVRIPPRTGSRIMSVRPMIPSGWEAFVEADFDETILPVADFKEAVNAAGTLIGLGDWRPKFGRFTVVVLK